MEFLYGDETKAIHFLKNITKEDNVAVISHNDIDGYTSGHLLNTSLNAKFIDFVGYSSDIAISRINLLNEKKINKVIFSDLKLWAEDILEFSKKFNGQILILDHHEYDSDLNSDKIIFMRSTGDYNPCASLIAYYLLNKSGFNVKDYDWLLSCAIVADWQFSKNIEFVRNIEEKYEFKKKVKNDIGAIDSTIGELIINMDYSRMYFYNDPERYYEIYKTIKSPKDTDKLKKYTDEVKSEVKEKLIEFENKC